MMDGKPARVKCKSVYSRVCWEGCYVAGQCTVEVE